MTRIVVLAKEPRCGRVKTRLCPPLTHLEAAELAEASLTTTLQAVAATGRPAPLVALDGRPGVWLPEGFDVVAQRGDSHDERIAHAFVDAGTPAFLIGMDSPQVTPELLEHALDRLAEPRTDAVLGLAEDGGWWGMGTVVADPAIVVGVPMSRADTGERQLQRLRSLGLRTRLLPTLRDVDLIDDARAVARMIPGSAFARTLERVDSGVVPVAT